MGTVMERVMTHEDYIRSIRDLAVQRLNDVNARGRLLNAKLVYGSGEPGTRGRCHFDAWKGDEHRDLLEVCAMGEESIVQIAGTTLHELAHALAGWPAGHGPLWKRAARSLGLRHAEAAGSSDSPEDFEPDLWEQICAMPHPSDGVPSFGIGTGLVGMPRFKARPCPLGRGTRRGRSRGKGSGSRLRLWICACKRAVRVRVASDDFRATCQVCGTAFKRVLSSPPTSQAPLPGTDVVPAGAAAPVMPTAAHPHPAPHPVKEKPMSTNETLESLGFRRHELPDGCTFWTGELPQAMRLPPDAFDALWQTHPHGYHEIRMRCGLVETPRWQQAYGHDYHYTGRVNQALAMTPQLEPFLEYPRQIDPGFNGLLINWYDAGLGHYIGRHRDSRKGLVAGSRIVTMSLGQSRIFRLRPWKGDGRVDFQAFHGWVGVMPFDTNLKWTHEVLKTRTPGQRISITARAFEGN